MGICGSAPLTEEEATNLKVVDAIFDIWGSSMMSKDASKLDALKPYGAEDLTFENDFENYSETKELFTVKPGPDAWVAWMKNIFHEKKFQPVPATLLPSGSFKVDCQAFGDTVRFRNVLSEYKVESTGATFKDDGKPIIEHHAITFRDGKLTKWTMRQADQSLPPKMAPALWGPQPVPASA